MLLEVRDSVIVGKAGREVVDTVAVEVAHREGVAELLLEPGQIPPELEVVDASRADRREADGTGGEGRRRRGDRVGSDRRQQREGASRGAPGQQESVHVRYAQAVLGKAHEPGARAAGKEPHGL
jgi:hypothetical protein